MYNPTSHCAYHCYDRHTIAILFSKVFYFCVLNNHAHLNLSEISQFNNISAYIKTYDYAASTDW